MTKRGLLLRVMTVFLLAALMIFVLCLCVSAALVAQNPPALDNTPSPQDQNKDQDKTQNKDIGKEKKDKKKDKKKKGSQDVLDTEVFSDDVARNVMNDLRDGLEGHMQRLLLSAFDGDKMDGYLSFEDQIQAMFDRYDSFRVHFRIVQTTVEGPKGVILVEFQMEEVPRGENAVPQRKSSQVRFELERGRKGWKIVDMNPRGFFS